MARPRRSEKTKENLIQKGIELISEQGYHGTGLKQILDEVNVPKGSFYNYFDSKETFAAEIISSYFGELVEQFEAFAEENSDDPRMVIKTIYNVMIDQYFANGCEKGCLIGNMAAEMGSSNQACQKALSQTISTWRHRFIPLFERGQELGQFRSDIAAKDLADIYWGAWEGAILRMKVEGDIEVLRRSVSLILETLFRE